MKTPTMRDIARHLNVSVTTVTKALHGHSDISDETKKRVHDAAQELGYVLNFMAAHMRRNNGTLIGLVLSDISKPFFSDIIYGYENTLAEAGYYTLLFTSYEDANKEFEHIKQLCSLNIAGIILDLAQGSEKSVPWLRSRGVPFVLTNRYQCAHEDHYVVADNEQAGYLATRHLLRHKTDEPVLCVNGPEGISPTVRRYAGYCRALREAERVVDRKYIFQDNYGLEDAYKAGLVAGRRCKPPFGVFCSTDQLALGFMRGIFECGLRIPEHVEVMGVDDIEEARFLTPALSTISLPKEQIGVQTAEMLIARMEGRQIPNPRILLEPVLQLRETTMD
jgi:LacI family transcriptional regulator